MSEYLEWFGSSSSFTKYGSFKEADRGKEIDRLYFRKIGGGLHGQHISAVMRIVLAFDDLEMKGGVLLVLRIVAIVVKAKIRTIAQPFFSCDHHRIFGDGHAIHDGNGMPTDIVTEFSVQYRSVHIEPVWIRPIEYHEWFAETEGGLHEFLEGGNICVEACAYVLYVEQHHIHILQILCRWPLLLPVQGYDGYAGPGVCFISHTFAGIGRTAKSMFGAEDDAYVQSKFKKRINEVRIAHHRGLIGEDAESLSFYQRKINRNAFGSWNDAGFILISLCIAWPGGTGEEGQHNQESGEESFHESCFVSVNDKSKEQENNHFDEAKYLNGCIGGNGLPCRFNLHIK